MRQSLVVGAASGRGPWLTIGVVCSLVVSFPVIGRAQSASAVGGGRIGVTMDNTDLPGGDITSYDLRFDVGPVHLSDQVDTARRIALARDCARLCSETSGCRAWTLTKYDVQSAAPGNRRRCWLKSRVPPAVSDTAFISGVFEPPPAVAAPSGGAMARAEPVVQFLTNTNLFGSDIGSFDIPSGRPEECAARCAQAPDCRAWTLVAPNMGQGPIAKCWIKNAVPPPQASKCCTSGVRQ